MLIHRMQSADRRQRQFVTRERLLYAAVMSRKKKMMEEGWMEKRIDIDGKKKDKQKGRVPP